MYSSRVSASPSWAELNEDLVCQMQWNIWGTCSWNLYPHPLLLLIFKRTVSSWVCAIWSTSHHVIFSTLTCRAGILLLWWCQGPVRTFFHLWSRSRAESEAQTLVWPAESSSLALECGKEGSTEGWEGGWGGRMVGLHCCAGGRAAAPAPSACAVWAFTQWSSVIRSHPHTYTKGCVIEQVMWGWIRGLSI